MRNSFSKHRSMAIWLFAVVSTILWIPTQQAYAYLDPGTGSFLLQILVAGFLGFLFALRVFRDQVGLFLSKVFRRDSGKDPAPSDASSDQE